MCTTIKIFPRFIQRASWASLPIIQQRAFTRHQLLQQQPTAHVPTEEDNMGYQLGSFMGKVKHNVAIYMAKGLVAKNLYEACADAVPYEQFMQACKMPDTFQSWFYIMHLHLWMLLVRLRSEGKPGKKISYNMVEIMWQDVEQRIKLMGVEDASQRRETLEEFTQQFFGLIIAYDEGLLSHDRVLASALWRNIFYNQQLTDAESLAMMVGYVRKQIKYLESIDSNKMLLEGKIQWLPLDEDSNEDHG